MPTRPIIGITPTPTLAALGHGTFRRQVINTGYLEAVIAAGGAPIVLPPQPDPERLLDLVDGLLVTGGGDIDPVVYGESTIHPTTYGIDAERDTFERALARAAIARDLPLLGICRGLQVLNVTLGGTLIQDIDDQLGPASTIGHRQQNRQIPADEIGHQVTIEPGTALARLYDNRPDLGVNSFHHQAIRDLGPGLVASARAADGTIEAVELPSRRFVLAVQWHPELMFERHATALVPFRGLIAAARAHARETTRTAAD